MCAFNLELTFPSSTPRFSPMLSIASFHQVKYVDETDVFVCLTTVDTFWRVFFFIGSISLFFLVPFFILLVLYSVIAKHLMNNPGIISYGHRSNILKYRKQVIFMLATVVISFFVCLLPFRGLTLWIIIAPEEDILALGIEKYYNILYFSRIMLYLNSAMNPILYNLMSSKFREGFFRLLGCRSFVVRKKFIHGVHKGTFHTTSTNLSSSQSNDRRIQHGHHKQQHQRAFGSSFSSSGYLSGGNQTNGSCNRKRLSETFDESTSAMMPNEYRIESSYANGGGRLTNGSGRKMKKNNFIIKKCLVESTVINAIAHEPAANKDLSRKLKENFTEAEPSQPPPSEFMSEIENLMEDDEFDGDDAEEETVVVVSRRNSRNLARRPSRHFEINRSNCREKNGNIVQGDVIVILVQAAANKAKAVIASSPIHEESSSIGGESLQDTKGQPMSNDNEENDKEEEKSDESKECEEKDEEPENLNNGVEFQFDEAVFLTAKESIV